MSLPTSFRWEGQVIRTN